MAASEAEASEGAEALMVEAREADQEAAAQPATTAVLMATLTAATGAGTSRGSSHCTHSPSHCSRCSRGTALRLSKCHPSMA